MTVEDVASPRASYEDAPLLSPIDTDLTSESSTSFPKLPPKREKPWIYVVGLGLFLIAVIDIGAFLSDPPRTRVFEANLCLRYFAAHDPTKIHDGAVPEELCKINPVQEKMATIMGWQELFDAIPGILMAIPMGTLADKYGRKWVFIPSLFGIQLNCVWVLLICYFRTLPLQLTWLSSAFLFVGGGPIVAMAIGMTIMSDVVPPEKRTTVFLLLAASVLVGEMLAPVLAAALMVYGDWLPLLLSLGIQQVAVCVAFAFPETLHMRDLPEPKDPDADQSIELESVKHHGFGLRAQVHNFRDALAFLKKDWMVALVIITFMANRLGRGALSLMLRYASQRYNWKIRQAAWLMSFRAATNLVALLAIVPAVNFALLRFVRLPAHRADLWLARGSVILCTLSFIIMGVSATPALLVFGLLVFNLGTGFSAAMRSVAIHVVGGQSSPDIARMFAVTAIMEGIGIFISGPLLSMLFQAGMNLGRAWLGIPFLFSALVFFGVTILTFLISVTVKEKMRFDEEEPESPNALPTRAEPHYTD